MKKRTIFLVVFSLLIVASLGFVWLAGATTNIDSVNRYAWSDASGWWDFYASGNVSVGTSSLLGWASTSVGEVALNCATTPLGDMCASSNYKVCNGDSTDGGATCTNTGQGYLSGCAWNDTIGWVSFWCGDYDCQSGNICGVSNYRVSINATGTFSGYAWNDVEGWISFNCANDSTCGSSNYKVQTTWQSGVSVGYLESSIFDTQASSGVALNSITWQGSQPAGTTVDFQIAVSNNSSGPWTYKGPSGSTSEYYGRACPVPGVSNPAAGPDTPICVDRSQVLNYRYLRYKARLQSDFAQTLSPQVDDVILNFSP